MQAQDAANLLVASVRASARDETPAALREALQAHLDEASRTLVSEPDMHEAWADGLDVPGHAYEALVAGFARRAAGQFQTPFWAADVMAKWLCREPVQTLLDPGVGTGRLLFRAARGPIPPASYVGLDVDNLCLQMARLNLGVRGVTPYALCQTDFLLDEAALRRAGLRDVAPDAIISNPPYSRHHALGGELKQELHRSFSERLGVKGLSRRAGLHAYFVLRALEVAAEGARLAFITPSGWLDVEYGKAVKEYILAHANVEGLVILGGRRLLFDGVLTTASIMLLRKDRDRAITTRVVRLGGSGRPEPADVVAALRGEPGPVRAREVRLQRMQRWTSPAVRSESGTELSEVARVRRGVATGANSFFVLSESERQHWEIEFDDLLPCLSRPRLFRESRISPEDLELLPDHARRWLLSPADAGAESRDSALGRYLQHGRALGIPGTYLAGARRVWFQPEQRGSCAIVMPVMHQGLPRVLRNHAGAVPLNSFNVIEPHDDALVETVWEVLSSPAVLRQIHRMSRNYGNGLRKIEPGELRKLRFSL